MNKFKRILTSKSFKKSSFNLCDALATLTRRLCTEYVDPTSIEAILENRLIPPFKKVITKPKKEDAAGVREMFRGKAINITEQGSQALKRSYWVQVILRPSHLDCDIAGRIFLERF